MKKFDLMTIKLRNGRRIKCLVKEVRGMYVDVVDTWSGETLGVERKKLSKLDPALIYVREPFKYVNELNVQRLKRNRIARMQKKLSILMKEIA